MKNQENYNFFKDKIEACWESEGNFHFSLENSQEDNTKYIIIYPAVREIFGGPNDGEMHFSEFAFNLNKFRKIFDKIPSMDLFAIGNISYISLVGKFNFNELNVLICSMPPKDSVSHEMFFAIGPKKGTIEKKILEEEENI